jgi:hypothetical protein
LQAPLGDNERQYATPEDMKHLVKFEGVSTSELNKENACGTSINKHHRDDTSTKVAHTLMHSAVTTPEDHLISNLTLNKDDEISEDEDDYDEEVDIEDDIDHQGAASISHHIDSKSALRRDFTISAFDRSNINDPSQGLQQMINMVKPFRNVIKRYWTDDEVRITDF